MKNTTAIILAAGRGTRMKSDVPKVLHEILGKPIIDYILEAVKAAEVRDVVVVAGYGSRQLKSSLKDVRVAIQKRLAGSGDAVAAAKSSLKSSRSGDILVVCGDTPLLRPDTLRAVINKHKASGAAATVLTVRLKDPASYGRIVRNSDGSIAKIVEAANASGPEKDIREINVGTYCFRAGTLFDALGKVKADRRKKEYFLTDAIEIINRAGGRIEAVLSDHPEETVGINTRQDLAMAGGYLRSRVLRRLMSEGVTIDDPGTTLIYPGVSVGPDTVIRSNTVIESDVRIGCSCQIGPFARIRPGSKLGDCVEIGNFVELVRTSVGNDTKIKHHTYLGDASVGKNVNIGAGTITANYDGKVKSKTFIGDGSFIGVGAVLIAPVRIGKRAVVGAGCVVPKNKNVPDGKTVVGVPARVLDKGKVGFKKGK